MGRVKSMVMSNAGGEVKGVRARCCRAVRLTCGLRVSAPTHSAFKYAVQAPSGLPERVVRLASGLACSVFVPQVHRLRRIYKWSVYPRAVPTFLTKLPASLLRYFQSTVCVLRHVVYSKHRVSLGTHIEDWRILCASHRQVNAVYYTSLQTGQ